MISYYDRVALLELIKNLYSVVGIRISIFDDVYDLVDEYPAQAPALCSLIRNSEKGRNACRACDIKAFERAKKLQAPHIYKCHAGITEAVTPIIIRGGIIGYSLFAHMLPAEDSINDIREICQKCTVYGLEEKEVLASVAQMQRYSQEKILASIHLLDAIASYLWVKGLASWKTENISAKIKEFVDNNIDKQLTSMHICKYFFISRTQLYNISQKAFGMGITQFITETRIEKAKKLLNSGDYNVCETAKAVGIPDYNYFCKVFKRKTGVSPGSLISKEK